MKSQESDPSDSGERQAHADQAKADAGVENTPPAPFDLRLVPAALIGWCVAWWAVAGTWRITMSAVLIAAGTGLLASLIALNYRPPRHRYDRRPGTGSDGTRFASHPAALVALCAWVSCAILISTTAALYERDQSSDGLLRGQESIDNETLILTVTSTPRQSMREQSEWVTMHARLEQLGAQRCEVPVFVVAPRSWEYVALGAAVQARGRVARQAHTRREVFLLLMHDPPRTVREPSGTLAWVGDLRARLRQAVGKSSDWPEGTRQLVPGVALGDDSQLPTEVAHDFRTVSLTHLTAVSGQHVVLVLGIVVGACGFLPRRPRAVCGFVVLLVLIVVVQPGGSVLRAGAMGVVVLLAMALGRGPTSIPALCTAVFSLLIIDPWQGRDYGFALSVCATGAIVVGAHPLASWINSRLRDEEWSCGSQGLRIRFMRRCFQSTCEVACVSLVAQAACAPILILITPVTGLWALPANVLAAPVVPLATVSALLATVLSLVWPAAAAIVVQPAVWSCAWLVTVAQYCADLPGAHIAWVGGVGGAFLLLGVEMIPIVLAMIYRKFT